MAAHDRVQRLDASHRGIPLDCLDPTLDIPSESSRRASIFDHSLGIPDSGARDRLSNHFGGPACDLSRLSRVHPLAYKGRKRSWRFAFFLLGAPFQVGAVTTLCWRRIRSASPVRRKGSIRRRIYGGSYLIYWIYPLADCCL